MSSTLRVVFATIVMMCGVCQWQTAVAQPPPPFAAPAGSSAQSTVNIESLPARPSASVATMEKLARMKPIFDGRTLDGWVQAPVAPFKLANEDVKDFSALTKKLAAKSGALAAFLNEQLDEAGKAALAPQAAGTPEAKQASSAVLRNLNRVIASDASIYSEARFKGVTIRAETDALRRKNPQGLALTRLNRLLLEDAFPAELVRAPATSWVVKDGAMASTGACRGSIFTKDDYSHYRLVFQVRQLSGNHVPGVLIFCTRPATHGDLAEAQAGVDALGGIQFQVPDGGHWDYRPGMNKAGDYFTRPVRIRFDLQRWAQVEILVNAKTGIARMAVAQPLGSRAIEVLRFNDPLAGKPGPIAWQMHNSGLFDEYKDVRIEIDPKEDRLITLE